MRRDPLQRDLRKFLTIDIFVQSRLRSVKCLADRELPPGRKGIIFPGIFKEILTGKEFLAVPLPHPAATSQAYKTPPM